MPWRTIIPLEKRIFAFALTFCIAMLGLVAFATWKYGVTVPGCLEDVKPFKEGSLTKKSEHFYELHIVAKMWSFDPGHINLPTGSTLDIFVSSLDVNHGFHIEGTNVNLSAVPGAVNYAQVQFAKPGTYHIVCHEYCGVAHHTMNAILHVADDIKEADILPLAAPAAPTPLANAVSPPTGKEPSTQALDPKLVELGKKVYAEKACSACHSLTEVKTVGPVFKGLFGSKVTLSDGSTVEANEAYITESIKEPQKKIVKGFESIPMPPLPVTDDEIKALIELIKSVR